MRNDFNIQHMCEFLETRRRFNTEVLGGGGVPKLGHESRQAHPLGCAPIPAYINNSICEANEISAHRLLGGKINYWSDLDQFLGLK